MAIAHINIGDLSVSRFILGGNPFSGFSHQGSGRDLEMIRYFTAERVQQTFRDAEKLGINIFLGRGDQYIVRMLREYHYNGGTLQWIGQTCPEMKSIRRSIEDIIAGGAQACFIHGGQMDFLYANNQLDEVPLAIDMIKEAGLKAGVAGHNPQVHQWAEKNLDVDFYMCSYYNSSHRDEQAEHISGMPEWFKPEDRDIMVQVIRTLRKPVIHYKILAAGRNNPAEAFNYTAQHLRENDAVCVGIYTNGKPDMIEEDIRLFEESLRSE